jgi:hypothetical protein
MAVSWFRSLPPGQKRSSMVRVCLNAEPVLVEEVAVLDDELLTDEDKLLEEDDELTLDELPVAL